MTHHFSRPETFSYTSQFTNLDFGHAHLSTYYDSSHEIYTTCSLFSLQQLSRRTHLQKQPLSCSKLPCKQIASKKDTFQQNSHILSSRTPNKLILEPLETRFKGIQLFRRSRDPKMYQRPSKMLCKTLFIKKLKTENDIPIFIALFSFMYHAYELKTIFIPCIYLA